jgi:hypothetical protein
MYKVTCRLVLKGGVHVDILEYEDINEAIYVAQYLASMAREKGDVSMTYKNGVIGRIHYPSRTWLVGEREIVDHRYFRKLLNDQGFETIDLQGVK